jgi:outer membrane protein insertion porin family
VSRTLEIYQKNIDPTSLSVSQYSSKTTGGAISFGIPVTETDSVVAGLRIEHTSLELFSNSPPIYYDFLNEFGDPTNSYILNGGWSRDTRDDVLFPTKGRLQSALLEVGLPFGDLPYYKATYLHQWFTPMPYVNDLVLMLRAEIGYADGYSGKPLPFFKAFYAGGVGSVRGYETASLGPRDIYNNALGGKRKIVGNRRALLSAAQRRQVGAYKPIRRCRPDLCPGIAARFRILPFFGAWAWRGIRRSVR